MSARRDVQLEASGTLVANAEDFLNAPPTRPARLLCLDGTPGSGKSTTLMRVAAALADRGHETLYYWSTERLRDDALDNLARSLAPEASFVVVIDDLNEHVLQVERFIKEFPTTGQRCLVIGGYRSNQRAFVERHLSKEIDLVRVSVLPLGQPEALDLVSKLRVVAKLGRFTSETDGSLAQRFVRGRETDWGGQLLVILLELIPGGRFVHKLESEWKSLSDESLRVLYGVVCLATAAGFEVKNFVLYRSLAPAALSAEQLRGGPLEGLVLPSTGPGFGYRARHRTVAEQIVRHCLTEEEIFDYSRRLVGALAHYVSRRTVISKTQEARLVRELMDADGLVIPRLGAQAEQWFEDIQAQWEWNSRYWEQRALVSLKNKRYARARDFAEQAMGAEEHPFPMTTAALVLLASVEHDDDLENEDRVRMFERAVSLVDGAIDFGRRIRLEEPHPFTVLFVHAVRVNRRLRIGTTHLKAAVSKHLAVAKSQFGDEPRIVDAIASLEREGLLSPGGQFGTSSI